MKCIRNDDGQFEIGVLDYVYSYQDHCCSADELVDFIYKKYEMPGVSEIVQEAFNSGYTYDLKEHIKQVHLTFNSIRDIIKGFLLLDTLVRDDINNFKSVTNTDLKGIYRAKFSNTFESGGINIKSFHYILCSSKTNAGIVFNIHDRDIINTTYQYALVLGSEMVFDVDISTPEPTCPRFYLISSEYW